MIFGCVCVSVRAHFFVSNSLQPHSLYPARLLFPWNFIGKNTGAGCHFLYQGDPSDPEIEPVSLEPPALAGGFFIIVPLEKPSIGKSSKQIQTSGSSNVTSSPSASPGNLLETWILRPRPSPIESKTESTLTLTSLLQLFPVLISHCYKELKSPLFSKLIFFLFWNQHFIDLGFMSLGEPDSWC